MHAITSRAPCDHYDMIAPAFKWISVEVSGHGTYADMLNKPPVASQLYKLLPPARRLCDLVGMSVCLSVSWKYNSKCCGRMSTRFSRSLAFCRMKTSLTSGYGLTFMELFCPRWIYALYWVIFQISSYKSHVLSWRWWRTLEIQLLLKRHADYLMATQQSPNSLLFINTKWKHGFDLTIRIVVNMPIHVKWEAF